MGGERIVCGLRRGSIDCSHGILAGSGLNSAWDDDRMDWTDLGGGLSGD